MQSKPSQRLSQRLGQRLIRISARTSEMLSVLSGGLSDRAPEPEAPRRADRHSTGVFEQTALQLPALQPSVGTNARSASAQSTGVVTTQSRNLPLADVPGAGRTLPCVPDLPDVGGMLISRARIRRHPSVRRLPGWLLHNLRYIWPGRKPESAHDGKQAVKLLPLLPVPLLSVEDDSATESDNERTRHDGKDARRTTAAPLPMRARATILRFPDRRRSADPRSPGLPERRRGVDPLPPASDDLEPIPVSSGTGKSTIVRLPGPVLPQPRPSIRRHAVVIPDCENETDSVRASLHFAGVLNKKGKFRARAQGIDIIQTGDLLHKQAPDLSVLRFWSRLRDAVQANGGTLHLVAGNHEIEIWRRLEAGAHYGLKRRELGELRAAIRSTKLFHIDGSILYIHGYPTVGLLRDMQTFQRSTGGTLDSYNRYRFQKALDEPKQLARYGYQRRAIPRGCLLHDVLDPERYYADHGAETADLLWSFGIDTVVHGHRPERSGVQTDYELQHRLPGIRMISGDVQSRRHGLGAAIVRQQDDVPPEVYFVNRANASRSHRKEVKPLPMVSKAVACAGRR